MNTSFDLNECPLIVIWEATQACDLSCCHCRACAQPIRHPQELTTAEGEKLIRDVADLNPPIFIFTGGDPLKRADIFHLVRYAVSQGLHPAMTPSATPLLTREAIVELKKSGLARLAVSLDASTPELHDKFRGVPGSYARTLQAIQWANEVGIPIQINTSLHNRNLHDLDNMAELVKGLKLVLWSLFFLVPTGRGQNDDLPSAAEFETTFSKLHEFSKEMPFRIKTTEAQHYRRFELQQRSLKNPAIFQDLTNGGVKNFPGLLPINDGKGFVFVSHIGEVYPSGFLPLKAGSVKTQSLTDIYRNSPLLMSLRDTANLHGKCGECEYKEICGGSRARAYATSGDLFGEDPCCTYIPKAVATAREQKLATLSPQST